MIRINTQKRQKRTVKKEKYWYIWYFAVAATSREEKGS
jgi:hypothetical protein